MLPYSRYSFPLESKGEESCWHSKFKCPAENWKIHRHHFHGLTPPFSPLHLPDEENQEILPLYPAEDFVPHGRLQSTELTWVVWQRLHSVVLKTHCLSFPIKEEDVIMTIRLWGALWTVICGFIRSSKIKYVRIIQLGLIGKGLRIISIIKRCL